MEGRARRVTARLQVTRRGPRLYDGQTVLKELCTWAARVSGHRAFFQYFSARTGCAVDSVYRRALGGAMVVRKQPHGGRAAYRLLLRATQVGQHRAQSQARL